MIVISIFFVSLLFFMMLAILIGAPLVSSKPEVARRMIDLLQIKPGQTVYDLGSGDGRLLILAAQNGAKAVGIEVNPYAVLWSYVRALLMGQLKNIRIIWGNYWGKDISQADALVVYAMPGFMPKLAKKLHTELKKNTPVVSNSFAIPDLKLIKQEMVENSRIYLYKV